MESLPVSIQSVINNIEWSTRLKLGGVVFGLLAIENIPPAPHKEDDITLKNDQWAERDENTGKYRHRMSNVFVGTFFTSLLAAFAYKNCYEKLTSDEKQAPLSRFEQAGFGIAVFGFGVRSLSKFWLGRYFTYSVSVKKDDHQVVDTGPYAIVRHPGYTGIILEWIGVCMYCKFNILITGWYGLGMSWLGERIRNEEKFLLNVVQKSDDAERVAFAEQYAKYVDRVKSRCFPLIW